MYDANHTFPGMRADESVVERQQGQCILTPVPYPRVTEQRMRSKNKFFVVLKLFRPPFGVQVWLTSSSQSNSKTHLF